MSEFQPGSIDPQLSQRYLDEASRLSGLEPELGGTRSLRGKEHPSGLGQPLAEWLADVSTRIYLGDGQHPPLVVGNEFDRDTFMAEFGDQIPLAIAELEKFPLVPARGIILLRLIPPVLQRAVDRYFGNNQQVETTVSNQGGFLARFETETATIGLNKREYYSSAARVAAYVDPNLGGISLIVRGERAYLYLAEDIYVVSFDKGDNGWAVSQPGRLW